MVNKVKFINLGISFLEVLKKNKDKKVIEFNKNEFYTFSDLNKFSEKLIKIFKVFKLKKKDIIAIESDKNIIAFSLIVACWKTGVSYSFFDSEDKSSRVHRILSNLKPKKIFIFNKNKKIKNSIFENFTKSVFFIEEKKIIKKDPIIINNKCLIKK